MRLGVYISQRQVYLFGNDGFSAKVLDMMKVGIISKGIEICSPHQRVCHFKSNERTVISALVLRESEYSPTVASVG